jgi:hypothetical protein
MAKSRPAIAAAICALVGSGSASASLYYDLDIAAQTGVGGLVIIESNAISINDSGRVAFIGDTSASAGFEGVYVQDPGGAPTLVSFSPTTSTRTFGPGLEINDNDQVIARDVFSGESLMRLWNSNVPASFTLLARSSTSPYSSLGLWPAVNNSGAGVWGAFNANQYLILPHLTPPANEFLVGNTFATRPAIANDNKVVGRLGPAANNTDPIVIIGPTGATTTLGSPTWTELGRSPAISKDGDIVVFAGNRGMGRGIFARDMNTGAIYRVAGENIGATPCTYLLKRTALNPTACDTNPDLGYGAAGTEIWLTFTPAQMDERLSVELQEPAGPGVTIGNSFVVLFQATPSAASPDNPAIGGTQPLLFSNQPGIFTARVDIDAQLLSPSMPVIHENSALPVAQVGDSLPVGGGITVNSFAVLDSLSNVALDAMGMPRAQKRGDHQVVFFASAGSTSYLIRAVSIDSDDDGLRDHWETDGIDVDQDGVSDLNLAAMGANPAARDLFLEIDWLRDNAGVSFRPVAAAIDFAVNLFAAAPTGPITLHVDAGSRLSRNMGSAPSLIQGGDAITDLAGHIDFIYFGVPGMTSPPFILRSFRELKDLYFGTTDKRAREFAFRYAIFGDQGGTPLSPFGGLGEVAFFSDDLSIPGNDFVITLGGAARPPPLPNGFDQYQTLAHELGHTLGLRHGGIDHVTTPPPIHGGHNSLRYKPDYLSLMNYSHTAGLPGIVASSTPTTVQVMAPTTYLGINGLANFAGLDVLNIEAATPGSGDRRAISMNVSNQITVGSSWTTNPVSGDTATVLRENFAGATDPVFDDWSAMELGFASSLDSIGTTFVADRSEPSSDPRADEPNADDFETYYGPADMELPEITIVSPMFSAGVGTGTNFLVSSEVTDDFGVAGVVVRFDTDGDGMIAPAEEVAATLELNGRWEVDIGPVGGPDEARIVTVEATDVSGRFNEETVAIAVPEPGAVLMLVSGGSLLAILGRRRARRRERRA